MSCRPLPLNNLSAAPSTLARPSPAAPPRQGDYWYHSASGGYPGSRPNCTIPGARGIGSLPIDFSNSTTGSIRGAPGLNGTYNTRLFADEAARLVRVHDAATPFYMYLAFMAVHQGCTGAEFRGLGLQAPMGTVQLYNRTVDDAYKVVGAMYTELDWGIEKVIAALKANDNMWGNTIMVFVSDNGGPLDHSTNTPLRGGKHTFFEGGVRVAAFISGPLIPAARRGTRWAGMAASADWYATIVEGFAGGLVPPHTGTREPDALNLWPAILSGGASPRTEVVHQVENQWSCDVTQPGGGCCSSIRMGEMKLIVGGPGDSRTVEIPEPCTPVPPVRPGYPAPCPTRGFLRGCQFSCGAKFHNCEECFGNATHSLVTDTAAACQAKCAAHRGCGAFQWVGKSRMCVFKCPGSVAPGRAECTIGLEERAAYICGPAHNDSNAPLPPPPPPPPPPSPDCPVPFGKSGGQVEPGTDHARAAGHKGDGRTDLTCTPYCLFNLTSDIGERFDLRSVPALEPLAQRMLARLRWHGTTGPRPAYIWPDPATFKAKEAQMCRSAVQRGFLEPIAP